MQCDPVDRKENQQDEMRPKDLGGPVVEQSDRLIDFESAPRFSVSFICHYEGRLPRGSSFTLTNFESNPRSPIGMPGAMQRIDPDCFE